MRNKKKKIIYEILHNFMSINNIKIVSFEFHGYFYCIDLTVEYDGCVYKFVHDRGDVYCINNNKTINCYHVERASDVVAELVIAFTNSITDALLTK